MVVIELKKNWAMKQTVLKWVEKASFQNFILTVIVLNALALGAETFHGLSENTFSMLYTFDQVCLVVFVVELLLKIYAYGWSFFKKPWCVFDFLIVAVTLVPNTGNLSVLRGLRVLRVLRLISSVPQLRMVVNGFLDAMPGMTVLDNPEEDKYPMPWDVAGEDDVFVGRIRQDMSHPNGLVLWIVSDNLRKGAALNSLQIAEELVSRGRLKPKHTSGVTS